MATIPIINLPLGKILELRPEDYTLGITFDGSELRVTLTRDWKKGWIDIPMDYASWISDETLLLLLREKIKVMVGKLEAMKTDTLLGDFNLNISKQ